MPLERERGLSVCLSSSSAAETGKVLKTLQYEEEKGGLAVAKQEGLEVGGGGRSLHGEGACIRTCLRGMAFRERGCSYRMCGSGMREKAGERAQPARLARLGEFGHPPWAMRNKTGPDWGVLEAINSGTGAENKQEWGEAGRLTYLESVSSTGFIPLFPPPTAASTVPFT